MIDRTAGTISSGVEPVYSKSYNRRLAVMTAHAIMTNGDKHEIIGEGDMYEFRIDAPDKEATEVYLPEKEKPWQERRKNNYKAKRRK